MQRAPGPAGGHATARERPAQALAVSSFRPILPVVLGEATGAFARARLQVRVVEARSSDEQLRQLQTGAVDVAHTALDNVVAWSAAEPVRVIGVVDLGVAHELVARDPIAGLAGLRGAVIGVDAPGNGFVVLLARMLAEAGLPAGAYRLRACGGIADRAAALDTGEIDACMLAGPALQRARAAGHRRLLAIRDRFPEYPALAIVARAPLEGPRRDTLRRYVRALHVAVGGIDDAPRTVHEVASVLGLADAPAAAWLATERGRMTGVVAGAAAAARVIAEALAATGRLPAGAGAPPYLELLMQGPPQ
jgi:ABC-type nitrate/sulfonate/bicarbonate transport system substrate-binding protein